MENQPKWLTISALYVYLSKSHHLIPLPHLAFPLWLFLGVFVYCTGNMANVSVPSDS
jgi:hypothetical protein